MKVTSSTLSLGSGVEKRVQKAFCEAAKSKLAGPKNAVNALVKNHQRDALDAVGQALKKGFSGGVHSGGSKTFGFSTPSRTRAYQSPVWDALSARYAASWPTSTVFWRKHRVGSDTYRKEGRPILLSLYSSAKVVQHRAHSSETKSRHTKKYCYLTWDVTFNTPSSEVLQRLITQPMIAGVERTPRPGYKKAKPSGFRGSIAANNRDISLMLFVEGRRPFVKDLSYLFGVSLRTEIKERL